MPSYVKFLKDIFTKKRKMTECEIVALMQVIIDVFKNGVPENMKDPESFTVPCSIGNVNLGRSLFDLGASINYI